MPHEPAPWHLSAAWPIRVPKKRIEFFGFFTKVGLDPVRAPRRNDVVPRFELDTRYES